MSFVSIATQLSLACHRQTDSHFSLGFLSPLTSSWPPRAPRPWLAPSQVRRWAETCPGAATPPATRAMPGGRLPPAASHSPRAPSPLRAPAAPVPPLFQEQIVIYFTSINNLKEDRPLEKILKACFVNFAENIRIFTCHAQSAHMGVVHCTYRVCPSGSSRPSRTTRCERKMSTADSRSVAGEAWLLKRFWTEFKDPRIDQEVCKDTANRNTEMCLTCRDALGQLLVSSLCLLQSLFEENIECLFHRRQAQISIRVEHWSTTWEQMGKGRSTCCRSEISCRNTSSRLPLSFSEREILIRRSSICKARTFIATKPIGLSNRQAIPLLSRVFQCDDVTCVTRTSWSCFFWTCWRSSARRSSSRAAISADSTTCWASLFFVAFALCSSAISLCVSEWMQSLCVRTVNQVFSHHWENTFLETKERNLHSNLLVWVVQNDLQTSVLFLRVFQVTLQNRDSWWALIPHLVSCSTDVKHLCACLLEQIRVPTFNVLISISCFFTALFSWLMASVERNDEKVPVQTQQLFAVEWNRAHTTKFAATVPIWFFSRSSLASKTFWRWSSSVFCFCSFSLQSNDFFLLLTQDIWPKLFCFSNLAITFTGKVT